MDDRVKVYGPLCHGEKWNGISWIGRKGTVRDVLKHVALGGFIVELDDTLEGMNGHLVTVHIHQLRKLKKVPSLKTVYITKAHLKKMRETKGGSRELSPNEPHPDCTDSWVKFERQK